MSSITDSTARLRTAIRALVKRFSVAERADVACCGMTVAQAATLEALGKDPGLRLGALGRSLGIQPSTLSRNIARLEERGLVTRVTDPRDRRASLVQLTNAGRLAAADIERQEHDFAATILASLPPGRADETVTALEDLLAVIRQATDSCCPGAFDHLLEETSCCENGEQDD